MVNVFAKSVTMKIKNLINNLVKVIHNIYLFQECNNSCLECYENMNNCTSCLDDLHILIDGVCHCSEFLNRIEVNK